MAKIQLTTQAWVILGLTFFCGVVALVLYVRPPWLMGEMSVEIKATVSEKDLQPLPTKLDLDGATVPEAADELKLKLDPVQLLQQQDLTPEEKRKLILEHLPPPPAGAAAPSEPNALVLAQEPEEDGEEAEKSGKQLPLLGLVQGTLLAVSLENKVDEVADGDLCVVRLAQEEILPNAKLLKGTQILGQCRKEGNQWRYQCKSLLLSSGPPPDERPLSGHGVLQQNGVFQSRFGTRMPSTFFVFIDKDI